MKEWTGLICCFCFTNIYVFLYAGSHFVFTVFDMTIDTQITNVTCNTNSSLFRNESATDDFDYCGNFNTAYICNMVIFVGGIMCYSLWLIVHFAFILIQSYQSRIYKTTVNQIKSENESLQTKLADKTLEIANLQRQLTNRRTDRRTGRVENPLPPYTEQENERGHLLTINRLPDYQSVQ